MKILVAITGASGVNLGIKVANALFDSGCDVSAIFSNASKISLNAELNANSVAASISLNAQNGDGDSDINPKLNPKITIYENSDLTAPPSSGSAKFEAMLIAPCSINTLAKIAAGISDTLILRAASVMMKERKKLILGVREMPFCTISLRQMASLSGDGVIIAPPIMAYYSNPKSLDDMENFIIGKWMDLLNINHTLFKRWN